MDSICTLVFPIRFPHFSNRSHSSIWKSDNWHKSSNYFCCTAGNIEQLLGNGLSFKGFGAMNGCIRDHCHEHSGMSRGKETPCALKLLEDTSKDRLFCNNIHQSLGDNDNFFYALGVRISLHLWIIKNGIFQFLIAAISTNSHAAAYSPVHLDDNDYFL